MTMMENSLASAADIRRNVAELLRPPRRIPVSESAADTMMAAHAAGRAPPRTPPTTPYITEPLHCLRSRLYDAVIFIGPSRSGKTMGLVDGWIAYTLDCDPGDMLVVQISEEKAREYSKKRLDRMLHSSPKLVPKLSNRGHDNNVHDRQFKAGNYLGIKWPSKNVLASSDYRFVALTDYDRLPLDIDGEGDAFSLASKRTQTYGSAGMTLAETSPGHEVADPDWRQPADEPHMAPPAPGGMHLYNLGDRRRYYWQCDDCREWFQPVLENWDRDAAQPVCPHCGTLVRPERKRELNLNGRWVPEGCEINADGEITGQRRDTRIASFWMEGPAASYQTWASLATKLRNAEQFYESTGDQETLKTVINTDWGRPYTHQQGAQARDSDSLMEKGEEVERKVVPHGVRFLTAAVDVQGGENRRFVVQVHGWYASRENWVVDRFNISEDRGPDNEDTPRQIDPGTRPEDWDVLTRDVLQRRYRIEGDDRRMEIALVAVDTGGEDGVTLQAYDWYRRLKALGLQRRTMLVKGASGKPAQMLRETYPDNTSRKDRKTKARGDVPVWQLDTDRFKDAVATMLDRPDPGANYMHIPSWLPRWWHEEMTYEVRGQDGKWRKPGRRPNEAFDLAYYSLAAYLKLGGDRIKWESPPAWASEWDSNPLVSDEENTQRINPAPARRKARRSRYRMR